MTGPQRAERLRRLVASRTRADQDGISAESMPVDEAAPPGSAEVTGRVEEAVRQRALQGDVGDPRDYDRALQVLLRATERATRRLDDDPGAALSPDEMHALEAVVETDGTRPSLLVRDNAVDTGQPLAAAWKDTLDGAGAALSTTIAAIGRVEPVHPTAGDFFGTCWVVDQGAGRALTNLHVVRAMQRRLPHTMARTDTGFRVFDGAFVDFAAESGSATTHRFRIVEAIPSGVDGTSFGRLDAAVLRLEPLPAGPPELPAAITVSADPDGPLGRLGACCVVGYPGKPLHPSAGADGVDWAWVFSTLFGNRYGVKRLAPGQTHRPLGSVAGDSRPWVFGHDATTLGGNSGSPVLNWADNAFGLHFAGASVESNYAHAISAIATELRGIGVPIDGDR